MRRAPKLPICQHYEMYKGSPVAVLLRNATTDKTEACPFCAQRHRHGEPDGHRNAHCDDNITHKRVGICLEPVKLTPEEIRASDGTILKRKHGYIIRTRTSQDTKDELISLATAVVQVLDKPEKKAISVSTLVGKAKRILQQHNS